MPGRRQNTRKRKKEVKMLGSGFANSHLAREASVRRGEGPEGTCYLNSLGAN